MSDAKKDPLKGYLKLERLMYELAGPNESPVDVHRELLKAIWRGEFDDQLLLQDESDLGCKDLLKAFNSLGPSFDRWFEPVHLEEISNWDSADYNRSLWGKEFRKWYIDEIAIKKGFAGKWNRARLNVRKFNEAGNRAKTPSKAMVSKTAPKFNCAIDAIRNMWPTGIPQNIDAETRHRRILEWCKGHPDKPSPPSTRVIVRAIASLRAK